MKPVNTNRNLNSHWLVTTIVFAVLVLALGLAPSARASYNASPAAQAATPTEVPVGGATGTVTVLAPLPEGSAQTAATATANAVAPVTTGGVPPAQPSGVAAPGGQVAGTTNNSSGSFPWLIVLGLGLIILAGLGFAVLRPRRTVPVVAPAAPRRVPAPQATRPTVPPGTTTTTTTTAAGAPATAAPVAASMAPSPTVPVDQQATVPMTPQQAVVPAVSAAAPAAVPTPAPLPATVKCPNCGTLNSTDEKFCHECGQDLRPEIAKLMPAAPSTSPVAPVAPAAGTAAGAFMAAPPEDVVDETTPYLETLDRVDEQLEFVLSRVKIGIGTAPGNDIIIDNSFKGWQTVSPRHAEMRREQDGFVIVDLGSEYGTFVNEMRTGENILASRDLVRLGDVRFVFHVPTMED